MSDLHTDQLRWAQMIKNAVPGGAKPVETIELTDAIEEEPLSFDSADLLGCDIESELPDINPNGFGECTVCRKTRRLWAGVCGWCGADPEDFDEE